MYGDDKTSCELKCRSCVETSDIRDDTVGPQNSIKIRPPKEETREVDKSCRRSQDVCCVGPGPLELSFQVGLWVLKWIKCKRGSAFECGNGTDAKRHV